MDAYEHYVLAIQKHGNLTLAAKAIGVSQPALSAGLNALEKKLDFLILLMEIEVTFQKLTPIHLKVQKPIH